MQNQKWKLKIKIQKSNSKMGIVFINSKTKFNFPSGLAFLFCEAIIAQPFCFVNRRKKFFHVHIQLHFHYHLQIQSQPHLHWHNHIHIRIHLHTTWRFCVIFVDGLIGWCTGFSYLPICPHICQHATHPSAYPQNFIYWLVYGFMG